MPFSVDSMPAALDAQDKRRPGESTRSRGTRYASRRVYCLLSSYRYGSTHTALARSRPASSRTRGRVDKRNKVDCQYVKFAIDSSQCQSWFSTYSIATMRWMVSTLYALHYFGSLTLRDSRCVYCISPSTCNTADHLWPEVSWNNNTHSICSALV